jgi:hypothetical protein
VRAARATACLPACLPESIAPLPKPPLALARPSPPVAAPLPAVPAVRQVSVGAEYGSQSSSEFHLALTKPKPWGRPLLADLRLHQLAHNCQRWSSYAELLRGGQVTLSRHMGGRGWHGAVTGDAYSPNGPPCSMLLFAASSLNSPLPLPPPPRSPAARTGDTR